MFKRNKIEVPRRERDGLVSHILLQKGDVFGDRLASTWVDLAPGSCQNPHSHSPEQICIFTRGKGRMRVGDEEKDVTVGDLVYIPSNTVHGIENISDEVLTYIAATTPAFDIEGLYDTGDLCAKPGDGR